MSFRRALGPFDATMIVIGAIIGSGIFINPYIVAQRLPSAPLVLAAWVAGGVVALIGALLYAELGALFPRVGGQYAYLRDGIHPLAGFLYGWGLLAVIETGAIAAVAITFAQYTLRLVGRPDVGPVPLAIAAIVVLSVVNYLGIKPGSRLLNVFVVLKVVALVFLIGAAFVVLARPAAGAAAAAVSALPVAPPQALPLSTLVLAFGASLIPIFFAYGGWQNLNYVAEEMRDPKRHMPISLVAGTAAVVVIYVLVNVVYLQVLGRDGLASTMTPAADAVSRLFGHGGDRFIAAAIAVSTFGFLDLAVLAPTRVYYAMAADGSFTPSVARLHPRFGTPSLAIVVQAVWAIVLALPLNWAALLFHASLQWERAGIYAKLLDYVVFADWIFFTGTAVSFFVFRRKVPLSVRGDSFVMPGYPVLPAIFALVGVAVVVSVVSSSPEQAARGALLLALGVPVFYFYRRRSAANRDEAAVRRG
ncbi:MAG: APC family permease [Bacteroidales bacterium]